MDRKKMSVRSRKGRKAETFWKVSERFGVASLVKLHIKTGRTHQIRVHCKTIGYPVVGDALYGGRRARLKHLPDDEIKSILKSAKRHMLHAEKLEFTHPVSNERMHFISPLPADMAKLIDALRRLKRTS